MFYKNEFYKYKRDIERILKYSLKDKDTLDQILALRWKYALLSIDLFGHPSDLFLRDKSNLNDPNPWMEFVAQVSGTLECYINNSKKVKSIQEHIAYLDNVPRNIEWLKQ